MSDLFEWLHDNPDVNESEFFTKCLLVYTEKYPTLTRTQFSLLYNFAWDLGHSYGYNEVLNYLLEVMYLYKELMGTMKEE